eukprot:CAMPEP_0118716570 /NCGR_PEP_ID=MMETSP0800-20121206/27573_1 /TAXON_ID=210618 ORGANISM="Striatella unipunctata, Strain CCMP2910" /NCGR_SAMPLE_ID=MMETSP0800 /ASSEMBLY_ACC=CAM_ASM_000638 /LENGTH=433 /DNA_ID=CAMNT_0006623003 /DNA_START=131 /DNA_END=1432 /DNA_ORIENTATION=+
MQHPGLPFYKPPKRQLQREDGEDGNDDGDDNNETGIFIFINDCIFAVSNDPLNFTLDPSYNCNVTKIQTQFNCTPVVDRGTIDVTVRYDFELNYNQQTDLIATTRELEADMLAHLARGLGLYDCNNNGNEVRALRQQRRQLQQDEEEGISPHFEEYDRNAIVAVRSTPFDEVDGTNDCSIPVALSPNIAQVTTCQAMTGAITRDLYYSVDGSIQQDILRFIKQGMDEDVYTSDKVRKVSFIGSRRPPITPLAPVVSVQDDDPRLLSRVGFTLAMLSASFLLLLFILLFAVWRRRRRDEQQKQFPLQPKPKKKKLLLVSDATLKDDLSDQASADAAWHKRRASPKKNNANVPTTEGAYVEGSLAACDSMALAPELPVKASPPPPPQAGNNNQYGDYFDNDVDNNKWAYDQKPLPVDPFVDAPLSPVKLQESYDM